jgi:hypothetical protein
MLDALVSALIDALALAGATLTRTAPPETIMNARRDDWPVRIRIRLRLGQPQL